MKVKVGVLALQGAFREHIDALKRLNMEELQILEVRTKEDLSQVDALIIPGGESTAISIIAERSGMVDSLKEFVHQKPTWGTCAGMILLAENIKNPKEGGQITLGAMKATVERNYFGSQVKSFETDLKIPQLGDEPVHTVFIRAPVIREASENAEILAKLSDKEIVALREGHLLATAFHPELTNDCRWHKYFVELTMKYKQSQ